MACGFIKTPGFILDFEEQTSIDYVFKKEGNGVYVFVIEGAFMIANEKLRKRDALGVWNTE